MQYPQIQFYRGSLVRLPSGRLKQVEELSSDDFLDNALLFDSQQHISNQHCPQTINTNNNTTTINNSFSNNQTVSLLANKQRPKNLSCHQLTDTNNNSNSSYSSSNHSIQQATSRRANSPNAMETEAIIDGEEDYFNVNDVEEEEEDVDDDDDEELDVVNSDADRKPAAVHHFRGTNSSASSKRHNHSNKYHQQEPSEDLCIGLSVVKDFLEVSGLASSVSPASSTGSNSLTGSDPLLNSEATAGGYLDLSCKSSNYQQRTPLNSPPITAAATFNQTVLIKFALGIDSGNRNIVFNEVPIDQPFFVFQRGWSSWNPQRTFDKFGLKCRKLKIGDTCISLFRKQRNAHPASQQQQQKPHQLLLQPPHSYHHHHNDQINLTSPLLPRSGGTEGLVGSRGSTNKRQQDSDQCNILFSTIKLV